MATSVAAALPSTTPYYQNESLCPTCSSLLTQTITDFGHSLRCLVCQSTSSQLMEDDATKVRITNKKWTLPGKQELLPVTLAADKLTDATSPYGPANFGLPCAVGSGLGRFKFEPYETQSDVISSPYFITTFDAFEVSESVCEMQVACTLPPDVIEMEETICDGIGQLDLESTSPASSTATSAANAAFAQTLTQALQQTTPAAVPAADSPDLASHATILRTVSAFMKGNKEKPPSFDRDVTLQLPRTSSIPPSMSRLATVETTTRSASSAAVPPFSTVKEETLSDLEVASDVSRTASTTGAKPQQVGTPAGTIPSGATPMDTTSSSSAAAAAAAAPGDLEPSPSPHFLASPKLEPIKLEDALEAAQTVEHDFGNFLGLDSFEHDNSYASMPLLQNPSDGELLGLTETLSTYVNGSHMGVETESSSGLNVRSFSLARGFSLQFGAALDEFGQIPGFGSGMPQHSLPTSSNSFGGGGGGFGSRSDSFNAGEPFGSHHQNLSRQPTTFGGMTTMETPAQPVSSQMSLGGTPSASPPPLYPASSAAAATTTSQNPPAQQIQNRLPSVLGQGVSTAASSTTPGQPVSGSGYIYQALQQQLTAFSAITQRFPSILTHGLLGLASFQQAYNRDLMARQFNQPMNSPLFDANGQLMSPMMPMDFGGGLLTSSPSIGVGMGGLPVGSLGMAGLGGGSEPSNPPSLPPYGGSGSQSLDRLSGSQELADYEAPLVGAFGAELANQMPRTGSDGYQIPSSTGLSPPVPSPSPFTASQQQHPHLAGMPMLDGATVAALSGVIANPPLLSSKQHRGDATAANTNGATSSHGFQASLAQLTKILDLVSGALREPLTEFFRLLKVDEVTSQLAAYMCAEIQKRGLCSTRQNSSVSASALYMALTMENKRPTQNEFCRKINFTEVTLRKVQNELITQWGLLVPPTYTPKHVPTSWPVRAKPPITPTDRSSAIPRRSVSSTIHAVRGEWPAPSPTLSSSTQAATGAASSSSTSSTNATQSGGAIGRTPSFLYPPPIAPSSATASSPTHVIHRDRPLPPGFVPIDTSLPTPTTLTTGTLFSAPDAINLSGDHIWVRPKPKSKSSPSATQTKKDQTQDSAATQMVIDEEESKEPVTTSTTFNLPKRPPINSLTTPEKFLTFQRKRPQ